MNKYSKSFRVDGAGTAYLVCMELFEGNRLSKRYEVSKNQ